MSTVVRTGCQKKPHESTLWIDDVHLSVRLLTYCLWFGFLRIYVDLAVFQPYLDLEAGDNQLTYCQWFPLRYDKRYYKNKC